MTIDSTQYWQLLLGSLLAGIGGLIGVRIIRSRLLYDLHKLPGPLGWPLLGNAIDVVGSRSLHLHKVTAGTKRQNSFAASSILHIVVSDCLVRTGTSVPFVRLQSWVCERSNTVVSTS